MLDPNDYRVWNDSLKPYCSYEEAVGTKFINSKELNYPGIELNGRQIYDDGKRSRKDS